MHATKRLFTPLMLGLAMSTPAGTEPAQAAPAQTEPAPTALPPGAEPALVPFAKKPRPTRSRNDVPEDILALLPWQGIYAVAGGTISPAWRVVVTSSGDLRAGSSAKPGASTTALIDKKRRKLDLATLTELVTLADRAWRETDGGKKKTVAKTPPAPLPKVPENPLEAVDYGEFLVIADGPQVFVLDPQGPITRPAAAALIKRLQVEAAK
ncbi:MAG TPA: hypothetical protein VGG33_14915 [Polyangia bacterium]